MYALRNLGDALDVTRRYLGSLGVVGWLKLGVIILLIGGFGIAGQAFNVPLGPETVDDTTLWIGLLIAGSALAIYVAFRYLAAVLEFVFVESLRSESIHFRRYARENLRRGMWLLVFRIALWIGLIVTLAALVGATVVFGGGGEISELTDGQVVGIILSVIVAFVGWGGVFTLTTGFVVPIMLLEDRGPISAWRRFVSTMISNWTGVLAFVFVAWLLGFLFWVVFFFVGFFVSLIGLIVFAIAAVALTEAHPSLGVLALGGILGGYVGYQYVVALIEAPLRSYVRYYALLLLGDTDSTLDLIPEQRGAIRPGDSTSSTGRPTTTESRTADGNGRESENEPSVRSRGNEFSSERLDEDSSGRADDTADERDDATDSTSDSDTSSSEIDDQFEPNDGDDRR